MSAIAIAIICAYLIGSLPTAYIVARLRKGIDIRTVGTRNMGAMNVFYQVGVVEGLLVLGIDIGKGAAAVFLARSLGVPLLAEFFAGGVAVLGHAFPIYLKFRGGKGGAPCIGVFAFFMPQAIPYYLALFLLGLLVTRYPTFSYSAAFICVPFIASFVYHSGALLVFSFLLILIPAIKYIPRVQEMYRAAGGWRRLVFRRSFTERL